MKIQTLVLLVLVFCLARADEYNSPEVEKYSEEANSQTETVESPAVKRKDTDIAQEDTKSQAALVENDQIAQKIKNGFCQYAVFKWYASGSSVRCSCMKCTCRRGNWGCVYHFAYCPYYYCGGKIYNPHTQLCCCGKIYTKRAFFNCCGYFYYNVRISKCCNFYTVKRKGANCPRYQITKG